MKKEDVLAKSKKENAYLDERERQEIRNSFGFGGVVICVLCFLFSILRVLNGEHFYEFGVIVFGYLGGTAWYNYKISQKKNFLIQGIACSIAVVSGFIGFFLLG